MTERADDYSDVREDALVMIASMRTALKNGVKHYALDGTLLTTEYAIADALQQDGRIELDVTERVERTTEAVELQLVRAEFGLAVA